MTYTTTMISIAVHPKGENPIFSEQSTLVSLDDEAGGAFIVISQEGGPSSVAPRTVLINPDELDLIYSTAKMLLSQDSVKDKE